MDWNNSKDLVDNDELYEDFVLESLPYLMRKTHLRNLKENDERQILLLKTKSIVTEKAHKQVTKMLQTSRIFPEYMLNYSGILEFEPGVFQDPITGKFNNTFAVILEEKKDLTLIQKQELTNLEKILDSMVDIVIRNNYPNEPSYKDIIFLISTLAKNIINYYPIIELENWEDASKIQSIEDSIYYRGINCSTLNHWLCRYLYKTGVSCTKLPVITSSGEEHSVLLIYLENTFWVVDPFIACITSNYNYFNPRRLDITKDSFLYDYKVAENINLNITKFILYDLQILLKKEVLS